MEALITDGQAESHHRLITRAIKYRAGPFRDLLETTDLTYVVIFITTS
jgi:hypothetical protein